VSKEIETSHMPSDLNQETFRVSLLPDRRAGHLMPVHVWFFIMRVCKQEPYSRRLPADATTKWDLTNGWRSSVNVFFEKETWNQDAGRHSRTQTGSLQNYKKSRRHPVGIIRGEALLLCIGCYLLLEGLYAVN
jgi:hypothetical protein